ncbi:hypothetical protein BJV78DRAFT_801419 [Lactifluus subvellereus]|nr:hypothetical protein BJV78DRAFT_801419 [Lactifluus subvellereus]
MQMDGWEDYLHTTFLGEHILFPSVRLTSFGTFISAAALSATICLTERSLTFALSRHWTPFRAIRHSRVRNALWRSALYALATLLRLLYMLLSMTFHVWLIIIIVLSLAVGQFFIEFCEDAHGPDHRNAYHLSLSPPPRRRRSRCKPKPTGLFIHPSNSNLARADAVAVEMGLHGSTEQVKAVRTSCDSDDDERMWERDRGRDTARALLGGVHAHSRLESQQDLFQVADSGSESDD